MPTGDGLKRKQVVRLLCRRIDRNLFWLWMSDAVRRLMSKPTASPAENRQRQEDHIECAASDDEDRRRGQPVVRSGRLRQELQRLFGHILCVVLLERDIRWKVRNINLGFCKLWDIQLKRNL